MALTNISVIGLGKLGLCLGAVLASKGFTVVGVDVDESKIALINKGESPIYEPGLGNLIRANRKRLIATSDYDYAIYESQATFIVVPTPSERSGEFSLRFVKLAVEKLGGYLKKKKSYHLVTLTSTVSPGSMDEIVKPLLEETSGKKCGRGIGLCYNPEFIALGDVVRGLLKPDFVLIGESDPKAGKLLSSIQKKVCDNSPKIERMNFQNAELTKVSLNSFVTMKMSFANTLAEICEHMPGGDVDRVTSALGNDRRIGPYYLKGAQGYGGPCFPRDNLAFQALAKRYGAQSKLARATHEVNLWQIQRLITRIISEGITPPAKISILGLTYKTNTNVIEQSQSLLLAQTLARIGFEVHAYDPALTNDSQSSIPAGISLEENPERCLANSNLCIIGTPWKSLAGIDKRLFDGKIVFDCWRAFGNPPKGKKYVPIGKYLEQ